MEPAGTGVPHEVTLVGERGTATIRELGDGRRQISVDAPGEQLPVTVREWATRYPLELIEHVLEVEGIARFCEEIARDESDTYLTLYLHHCILSYLPPEDFAGKRLLDFGCGAGASTMVLARMFPQTEIVGVDIDARMIELARHRARWMETASVRFEPSEPCALPPDVGTFDFIVLSAVWEHLMPEERSLLVPRLWRTLEGGGVLFLNQTPHRWYPIERHTTGLPLLNYAPASLACRAANRFSARLPGNESWDQLLRRGIRGGTAREVMRVLRRTGDGHPRLLQPSRLGAKDPVDIWYAYSQRLAPMPVKAKMRRVFKIVSGLTGSTFAPGIDIAVEKRR